MNDALPLFGLAALLSSVAVLVWTVGRLWLKAKELERSATTPLASNSAATIAGMLTQVEARLGRLEQSVDATAIEIERLAEVQRFAVRLAAGEKSSPEPAAPGATRTPVD